VTTPTPAETPIPEDAVEATAELLHKLFGMKRDWIDLGAARKDVRREQAKLLLRTAGYKDPKAAQAIGYAHAATRANAALKLISPDHITPVGERQVIRALEDNPYLDGPSVDEGTEERS